MSCLHHLGQKSKILETGAEEWVCLLNKWVWSSCSHQLHKEVGQKTVHRHLEQRGLRHLDWWVGHPAVAPPLDHFPEEGDTQEEDLRHQRRKGRILGGGAEEWVCPQQKCVGGRWLGQLCMEVGQTTACQHLEHRAVGHQG